MLLTLALAIVGSLVSKPRMRRLVPGESLVAVVATGLAVLVLLELGRLG